MNQKRVLTDADDVLLAWYHTFVRWAASHHQLYPHDDKYYHHADMYELENAFGVSAETILEYISEFNNSDEMSRLPVYRDAQYGIQKLRDYGYSIGVISSLGNTDRNLRNRKKNLEDIFGPGTFEFVECLPMNSSKRDTLRRFEGTGYWWIEDKWQNALDGHELGLRSILLTHNHTNHFEHQEIRKVDTWLQICDIILNE